MKFTKKSNIDTYSKERYTNLATLLSVILIQWFSCTLIRCSNKQKYNWQFNGEIKSTESLRNQKQIMTKLHNKKIYFGNFLIKNKSRIFIQILVTDENDGK